MDPLASKYIFNKTRKKYFSRPPTGTFRTTSINKVAGIGYTAKNRAVFYTPIHGRVIYNTTKKIANAIFTPIQTARGPLTVSQLKTVKTENHQSGSGKLKKKTLSQKNAQTSAKEANAQQKSLDLGQRFPDNNNPDEDPDEQDEDFKKQNEDPEEEDFEQRFPNYNDPDEDPEEEDLKNIVLKSFEHPVFKVKTTGVAEPMLKTGAGKSPIKKPQQKTSSAKYLSGISFI
jgi:hypothetical protein